MGSKLTYATIPNEIKQIANEALGLGVLKSLFTQSYTYHLMIKISDGEFIGFSLYHFQKTNKKGENGIIGVIDCVCVSKNYRKEGFGTLLTFGTLRKMASSGANEIELVLKTPEINDTDGLPGSPLLGDEKLLFCLGFRKVKVIDNHYKQKSIKYNYDCNFCNNKPDNCKAILYMIDSIE